MRRDAVLSPLGTARLAFAERRGAASPVAGLSEDVLVGARDLDLGPETLYLAWEIARQASGLSPREERAAFLLVLATLVARDQGSTRLPVGGGALERILSELGATAADQDTVRALLAAPDALAPVLGVPGDVRPLILDGGVLYHQKLRVLEGRLADALGRRVSEPAESEADVVSALEDVLARPPHLGGEAMTLSGRQCDAVRLAASRKLAVVTGGPGTGKTSIVVAVLRVLARLGVPPGSVALAAPTGKAAQRMEDSVRRSLTSLANPGPEDAALLDELGEARTLHRLLGYSPRSGRYHHHENSPLAYRWVLVDEGSMIDLPLMERLLRALSPDTHLVLFGDADQLPSVEAGAVFRDLVDVAPGVRLEESYRADVADPGGRAILEAAAAILAGQDPSQQPGLLHETPDAQALQAFLDEWFAKWVWRPDMDRLIDRVYVRGKDGFDDDARADLDALFAHISSSRVLCVTRESRATGAERINDFFHRKIAESTSAGRNLGRSLSFYPGEPLLMHHNDYELGLFNGDQGVVLRVADGPDGRWHFMAVFPGRGDYGVFHLDALRQSVTHAFAMTVHKAQGSEFDHVAVVLPQKDLPLLSRELLYTAVTRARKSVVVAGTSELLARGVRRKLERYCGVRDRMSGT